MEMDVAIIEMPGLRVAAMPHKGPYHEIAGAFGRLGQIAGAAGLFGHASTMLAIYHDDPRTTPATDLRSEAGIVFADGVAVPQGLVEVRIPAGRFARTIHVGPYEELPEIWPRFMGEWLAGSGHKKRGDANFEIYRNTPGEVPKEKLITELYIAIV
jgi:AraC family transcriptional regulator